LFDESLNLFHKIPWKIVESWNVMIVGYAHNGHGQEALNIFEQMQVEGMNINVKTFSISLHGPTVL
jgi:pentatricopeptide repeat protein